MDEVPCPEDPKALAKYQEELDTERRCECIFLAQRPRIGHTSRENVELLGRYVVERRNARLEIFGDHLLRYMSQPIWCVIIQSSKTIGADNELAGKLYMSLQHGSSLSMGLEPTENVASSRKSPESKT